MVQENHPGATMPGVDLAALLAGIGTPTAPGTTPDGSRLAEHLLPLILPVLRQELERSMCQALGTVLRRLADNLEGMGASPPKEAAIPESPAPVAAEPEVPFVAAAADAPPHSPTVLRPPDDPVDLAAPFPPEPVATAFDPPRLAVAQTALNINLTDEESTAAPERPKIAASRGSRDQKAASHLRRGNILVERGRLDDAITEYTAAIELAPAQALAYLNRSLAHARKGEHSHAADDADQALQLDPGLKSAYYVRATARAGLGAHEQALADLTHLVGIDPRNVLALNERGLIHVGRGDYEPAIADYSSALAIAPRFMLARFNRGIAHRLNGDLPSALDDLDAVVERNPRSAAVHHQRGLVQLAREAVEEAAEDFATVLQIDPHHADAASMLSQARRRLDNARAGSPAVEATVGSGEAESAAADAPAVAAPAVVAAAPPPASSEATPAVRPAAAAQHIRMTCPECGAAGQIRSDRLNRVLQCRRCWKMFRITNDGVLVEFVPPNLRPTRWTTIRKRVRWMLPLAASFMLLAAVTVVLLRPARAPALPPLPVDLEARAELLADAWLRKDTLTMRRLTLPTHDRLLNAWLAYHRPPSARADDSPPPSIAIRVVRRETERAQLIIAVESPSGGAKKVEWTQAWEARGTNWYFVPPLPQVEKNPGHPASTKR